MQHLINDNQIFLHLVSLESQESFKFLKIFCRGWGGVTITILQFTITQLIRNCFTPIKRLCTPDPNFLCTAKILFNWMVSCNIKLKFS